MKPEPHFFRSRLASTSNPNIEENESFWAHVRTISEELTYTASDGGIFAPADVPMIAKGLKSLRLATEHVIDANGRPTQFGNDLHAYLAFRANKLNTEVKPRLMDEQAAKAEFIRCMRKYRPDPLSLSWNKQKGAKKAPAYLTCIVNMVLAHELGEAACDLDPQSLTTVTVGGKPFRTLARRVDGAYPRVVNPTAVWEIKEYYYTTSFGSRIADGIYESLLDGLELEGMSESRHGRIFHYLIVDAADTWWGQGNPYLCRIIDMLHMGYLDEAIVGSETEPALVGAAAEWRCHRAEWLEIDGREADEAAYVGVTPPPKHKRLQPADRRRRAAKWNEWARQNGIGDIAAVADELAQDRATRLRWQAQRKGLPPKLEPDDAGDES